MVAIAARTVFVRDHFGIGGTALSPWCFWASTRSPDGENAMTMSYTETRAAPPPPRAAATAEEPYVPVYARKAPKKGATPWLMAAPVALAAAGVIGWMLMAGGDETAPAQEEAALISQPLNDPLLAAPTDEPLLTEAPLAPTAPAMEQAAVEAAPAPAPRAAAPVRRAAPAAPAARAAPVEAAPAAEEAATPTGPQPYLSAPAAETPAPATPAAEAAPTPPPPIIVTEPIG